MSALAEGIFKKFIVYDLEWGTGIMHYGHGQYHALTVGQYSSKSGSQ